MTIKRKSELLVQLILIQKNIEKNMDKIAEEKGEEFLSFFVDKMTEVNDKIDELVKERENVNKE